MIAATRYAVATLLILAVAPMAAAQSRDPAFRPKHVVASVGVFTSSGFVIGDLTAELRRNGTGTPGPFTLFRAESAFDRTLGAETRLAVAVTRLFAVEVGATYSMPTLAIAITQDAESSPAALATTTTQYTVDVSGVYQIPRLRLGTRARPYVIGGGGYVRQLPEGRLLVETGHTIHVGGGVRYWLYGGSVAQRAVGARAEARMVRRSGGIHFESGERVYPALSVLGFVGF